ncbi:uncharacterized protein LOC125189569 [Salvia hispanica]|uniref:uncharacterized protein LOC125189569 n=1 Tax=Salvia hispanica TaxID=49212 RepID=UPI00200923A2|nr:uncharacterized protein LOC125189569 [Salvia hispanica]
MNEPNAHSTLMHVAAASYNNNARIQFEAFQDQRNSVASILRSNTREMEVAYRIRLTVSLNLTWFLLSKDYLFVDMMSQAVLQVELQSFREDGWEDIHDQATKLCELHNISQVDRDEIIPHRGYKKYGAELITNMHHYRAEIFNQGVDLTIQEMDNRFSKASTELLGCISCLDPRNYFSQFNDDQFAALCNLGDVATKMVKSGKHLVFLLVYRIIELALVLPVATASVERAFSAMKTIKTDLRNRMGDE